MWEADKMKTMQLPKIITKPRGIPAYGVWYSGQMQKYGILSQC